MTALDTRRLRLRPFTLADHAAHAQIYSDPEVMRYMPRGPLTPSEASQASQEVLRRFIDHWTRYAYGVWAVTDKGTGTLLGQRHAGMRPRGCDASVGSDRDRTHPEGGRRHRRRPSRDRELAFAGQRSV